MWGLPHTPPEALPLDSAKGLLTLWNPIIGFYILFRQSPGAALSGGFNLSKKLQAKYFRERLHLQGVPS